MSKQRENNRPSFTSPLMAALRQGSKEAAQALKAFPDSLQPVEEPGTLGNPTMQMVTEQMRGAANYEEVLEHFGGKEQEQPQREQEMERE